MRVLVVTGGIGSGKSKVCAILEEVYGFPVYDADSRVKGLYESDPEMLDSIEEALGQSFRTEDGKFSPSLLAGRIFSDEEDLAKVASVLKATPANVVEKAEHIIADMKALQSELDSLKSKAAKDALGDVMNQVVDVKGMKLLATSVDGVDMNGLRDLGDQLKGKLGEGVVVLASNADGKVNLIAMATDGAMAKGAHAGNLIKGIAGLVGGGGGGRPNMAQAGGKNPAGIPEAVAEAAKVIENSQRDINIAFMNELAMVFDRMGIDTNEVVDGMNTKWNALGFRPGLVGGHCIGVDPYYFIYEAEKLGFKRIIVPYGNRTASSASINIIPVKNIGQALSELNSKEIIK